MDQMTFSRDEMLKQSITELAARLVGIPSRANEDSPERIIETLAQWLTRAGLAPTILRSREFPHPVGLYVQVSSGHPGPMLCLNACLDTAPFGLLESWSRDPTSAALKDGRLYGRGAADSKTGVALVSHLAVEAFQAPFLPQGDLVVVFDADEHTGGFEGIRQFLINISRPPDAAAIAYPGDTALVIGARGFLRATLSITGEAAHSGSRILRGVNAIDKMSTLISNLSSANLPVQESADFSFGPTLTVTGVRGGGSFTQVPDSCFCDVDVRLTPNFDENRARAWLIDQLQQIDSARPSPRPSSIAVHRSCPPYSVPANTPLVEAFLDALRTVLSREIPTTVSGRSNVGNLLAARGVPTLCGFGVPYANAHGPDEYADLLPLLATYRVYRLGVLNYLSRATAVTTRKSET